MPATLEPRRVLGLGLVVLVTAVLSNTSAHEPGLGDLNKQSFWKQFGDGFRGLEEAALSQATRLQHALQQAMHPGKKAEGDAATAESAVPGNEGASASSASVSGHILHSFSDLMGGQDSEEDPETDDSSEEDSEPSFAGFPGPLMFPNIFANPFNVVWWKGPNVCVTREEISDPSESGTELRRKDKEESESTSSSEEDDSSPEDHGVRVPLLKLMQQPPMMNLLHFSSCSQTQTKYQCVTKSVNHGIPQNLVTTYRCCHGSRRELGKPGCTMVEMSSLLDTARDLDGTLFAKMLTSSGLEEMVSLDRNATLFVPTDDAMRDFIDGIQDANRVRRALGPRPANPVMVADEESYPSVPDRAPADKVPEPQALPLASALEEVEVVVEGGNGVPHEESKRNENQVPVEPPVGRTGRVGDKEQDPLDAELVDLEDRTLVLSHRVDGIVDLHEARNDAILNTTADTIIRLNVYSGPLGRTVTANCARVTKDRPAVGGMVHQVDKVLRPVARDRTLARLVEQDPRLTTIRALLRVSDTMELLQEAGPLTVFLPTDEAFRKMDPVMRTELLKGEACVGSFVRNLIVKHTVCTAAAALRLTAPNMNGEYLMLERMPSDDGKLTLDDVDLGAHDIMASNGVLHMLNDVLVPDSARPVKDMLKARNLTRWYDLLEKADLLDVLDHTKNITMFVPTEKALRTPEGELLLSWENKENLRELLQYHIAKPALEADDLMNAQELDSALDGQHLLVNLYSTIPFLTNAVTSATVQCGRLESVNNKACGAVLHEVDRVLTPPKEPMMGLVQGEEFSVLRDIITTSSYGPFLSAPSSPFQRPFTLLAPLDAAFKENVSAERLAQLKSDKKQADAFMQRHILPSTLCCAGVGTSTWLFTNRVSTLKDNLSYRIRKDSHNRVRIGDAVVQQCDKIATNGVMHVIDTPLIPSKGVTQPSTNNRRRNSNLEILLFGLK